ncbi:hypothetical protein AC791_10815 [Klebsiella sp. RIT-PI-d]|nr:hypothetical protein AC791_10815 [Klebsiella sp. RIT-PI-d]
MSAKRFGLALALQHHPFGSDNRPFRIIPILINAALIAGLRALTGGCKYLRRDIDLDIGTNALLRVHTGTGEDHNSDGADLLHIIYFLNIFIAYYNQCQLKVLSSLFIMMDCRV